MKFRLFSIYTLLLLVTCILRADDPPLEKVFVRGSISGSGVSCEILLGPGAINSSAGGLVDGQTWLYPGKKYQLTFNATNMGASSTIILTPPQGYYFLINGIQRNRIQVNNDIGSGAVTEVHDVEMRLGRAGGVPGTSTGVAVGDISWGVNLGRLYNGTLAGSIVIREEALTTALFDRSVLNYTGVSQQVSVLNDAQGRMRQVIAPEVFIDVKDVTGGFSLEFYPLSSLGSLQNGVHLVSNAAAKYVTFTIKPGTTQGTLDVVRTAGDATQTTRVQYNSNVWFTTLDSELAIETRTAGVDANGDRTETIVLKNGNNVIARKVVNTYHVFPWNQQVDFPKADELIKVVSDPDGAALTTTLDYYTDASQTGSYTQLKSSRYPAGGWVKYEYYETAGDARRGQVRRIYTPWKDLPADPTGASLTSGQVTELDYALDWDGVASILSSKVVKVNGVTVEQQTATVTTNQSSNGLLYWTREEKVYHTSSGFLTSVARNYQPNQSETNSIFNGLPYSRIYPDQTKTSFLYQRGTFNQTTGSFVVSSTGNDLKETALSGSVSVSAISTYDGLAIDPIGLTAGRSSKTVRILKGGRLLRDEVYIYSTTGFTTAPVAWTNYSYTPSGRLQRRESSTGAIYQATWENEFKTEEVTESGVEYLYSPDAIQRVRLVTKSGAPAFTDNGVTYPAQPDMSTLLGYNAAGDVLSTTTYGGSSTLTASATFDLSGRKTQETDTRNYTVNYTYELGGRRVTSTLPTTGTHIVLSHLDGQTSSLAGTARVANLYDYQYGADGHLTTTLYAHSTTSGAWSKLTTDWAGRVIEQRSPSTQANVDAVATISYNSLGKRQKVTSPGQPATLYAYDTLGALEFVGLDVNGDNLLTAASLDRLTKQEVRFVQEGGAWWQQQQTFVYPKGSATQNDDTAIRSSTTKVRLNGFPSGVFAQTSMIDLFGNQTVSLTEVDALNKIVQNSTDSPGSNVDASTTLHNGLLVDTIDTLGERIGYRYDAFGRQVKAIHPRKPALVTQYVSGKNLVDQRFYENGSILEKFTYDAAARISRVDDGLGNFIMRSYDGCSCGRLHRVWGSGTHPTEYNYDELGRLRTQVTFRGGDNWTSVAMPTANFDDQSLREVTTYDYYTGTEFLKKQTDAAGKYVEFTYDLAGRVITQQQARMHASAALTTTNTFDSATGNLQGVSYSDGTSSLAFTYTRLGQPKTVTDATGVRTFNYDGTTGLQLMDEVLPTFFGANKKVYYNYEGSQNALPGRPSGVTFGTVADPALFQSVSYAFSARGQLIGITVGPSSAQRTFSYAYVNNQPGLVHTLSQTTSGYLATKEYDTEFDMVKTITHGINSTIVSKHEYLINSLGQRESAKQSGTAFSDYGEATFYRHYYNARGEVTDSVQYLGTNVQSLDQPLPGRTFKFDYDAMGNRKSSNHTGVASLAEEASFNRLNQLESKENNLVHFSGTGVTGMRVVAQTPYVSQPGYRGRFWSTEVGLANVSTPAKAAIPLVFGKASAGSGGADALATNSRTVFLPAATEAFIYDDDGNLKQDGKWDYVYDARNQLVRMETKSAVIGVLQSVAGGEQPKAIEFVYDYQGRRVGKKVYNRSGTQWILASERRYVYQGWNVIAELNGDADKTVARQFFWGLDVTSTLTGAGGVGALVMIQEGSHQYLPTYDGNGNVTTLVRASDSAVVAAYEYSPFGELLRVEGEYAQANPFRFSTKWTDDESGLVYYGLRFYSPRMGRFINRDPIGAKGGLNLYGFVGNNPVNRWDLLGMQWFSFNKEDNLKENLDAATERARKDQEEREKEERRKQQENQLPPHVVTADKWTAIDEASYQADLREHSLMMLKLTDSITGPILTDGPMDTPPPVAPNNKADQDKRDYCKDLEQKLIGEGKNIERNAQRLSGLSRRRDEMVNSFREANDQAAIDAIGGFFMDGAEFAFGRKFTGAIGMGGNLAFRFQTLEKASGGTTYDKVSAGANASLGLISIGYEFGNPVSGSQQAIARRMPLVAIGVAAIKFGENFAPYILDEMRASRTIGGIEELMDDAKAEMIKSGEMGGHYSRWYHEAGCAKLNVK